jgi:ketosteroid isomerase-like protein
MSCGETSDSKSAKWKQEILDQESAFAAMAEREGIEKAFLAFAADEAVLSRNNEIISGRANIEKWFKARPQAKGTLLEWKPDFIDVSSAGDLAYTYGNYQFTSIDSVGNKEVRTGIFHTVWKRQQDGSWKFVWD